MKILMVLTSHSQLGDSGEKTGFWLEEFAAPYYVFKDAGVEIVLASVKGGQPPIDPKSDAPDAQTEATIRFKEDEASKTQLANTVPLLQIDSTDYDAIFYPGGHGPLWDLADDEHSIALIENSIEANKPVALVCHAPGILKNVMAADGAPLVKGRNVTGFSNSEEAGVGLTDVVPFLLEDMLKEKGGHFSKGADQTEYVVQDGLLITGQNPGSSKKAAEALLAELEQ